MLPGLLLCTEGWLCWSSAACMTRSYTECNFRDQPSAYCTNEYDSSQHTCESECRLRPCASAALCMTVHPKMKLYPVVVHKPTTCCTVLDMHMTAASTPECWCQLRLPAAAAALQDCPTHDQESAACATNSCCFPKHTQHYSSTPVNVGVGCALLHPLPLCRTVDHILLLCFPLFFLSSILQQLLPLCTGL